MPSLRLPWSAWIEFGGASACSTDRAGPPYRSGRSCEWINVKAPAAIAAQKIRSENRIH
jgi:hypothetical protein